MTTVLLTGFGPFPGMPANATRELVPVLARRARLRFAGVQVRSALLPTEWVRGPQHASSALERAQPDIVIHFGVSERAAGFVIERRGVNVCASSADGAGALPAAALLEPDGPQQRAVNLPVDLIVDRLRGLGLPAALSDDAGQYLCNAVLYQSLARLAGSGAIAGFVHLPHALPQTREGAAAGLTFAEAVTGGLEIIAVCLEQRAAA